MARRDPAGTRQELLEAAFEEMYVHGFQATGLDRILDRTGVTKGALYHHFANKQELGYAVLDEVIGPKLLGPWVDGLAGTTEPVDTLRELMYETMSTVRRMEHGCPLNNLTQEMSRVDEGFRRRIEAILRDWRHAVEGALSRGLEAGTVRPDVDAVATAAFLIAGWEGMAGMVKGTQDKALLASMARVMEQFLETLRAVPAGVDA